MSRAATPGEFLEHPRHFSWVFLFCLFACTCSSTASAQPAVLPSDPYLEVAHRLEPWIATEIAQKGIPALSIALVDDQKIVWARGFGFADPAKQVPATAETVYRVGSVSKLFTDLAVMQLGRARQDRSR